MSPLAKKLYRYVMETEQWMEEAYKWTEAEQEFIDGCNDDEWYLYDNFTSHLQLRNDRIRMWFWDVKLTLAWHLARFV